MNIIIAVSTEIITNILEIVTILISIKVLIKVFKFYLEGVTTKIYRTEDLKKIECF